MKYDMTKPCANCPFRNDITAFLRPERVEEIATSQGEFPCHKTTEFDDDGERQETDGEHHFAGFLIFREKTEGANQMMRICERIGIYDPSKLDMSAPVFDSLEEMIDAQPV